LGSPLVFLRCSCSDVTVQIPKGFSHVSSHKGSPVKYSVSFQPFPHIGRHQWKTFQYFLAHPQCKIASKHLQRISSVFLEYPHVGGTQKGNQPAITMFQDGISGPPRCVSTFATSDDTRLHLQILHGAVRLFCILLCSKIDHAQLCSCLKRARICMTWTLGGGDPLMITYHSCMLDVLRPQFL